MSIQQDIRKKLDSLVADMNAAADAGVRVEFNLSNVTGKYTVERFECWGRIADEGQTKQ